jgi:hypothetical protein
MSSLRRSLLRLANACRPSRAEPDLDREMASHLRLLEDNFQRRGLSSEEARFAAKRAFGSVAQAKDLHRDARSFMWLTMKPAVYLVAAQWRVESTDNLIVRVVGDAAGFVDLIRRVVMSVDRTQPVADIRTMDGTPCDLCGRDGSPQTGVARRSSSRWLDGDASASDC